MNMHKDQTDRSDEGSEGYSYPMGMCISHMHGPI